MVFDSIVVTGKQLAYRFQSLTFKTMNNPVGLGSLYQRRITELFFFMILVCLNLCQIFFFLSFPNLFQKYLKKISTRTKNSKQTKQIYRNCIRPADINDFFLFIFQVLKQSLTELNIKFYPYLRTLCSILFKSPSFHRNSCLKSCYVFKHKTIYCHC